MERTVDLSGMIRVAHPCSVPWESMKPEGSGRYCESCGLHVHDLSLVGRTEALALIRAVGDRRLCVSSYAGPLGELLTRDDVAEMRAARRTELARRLLRRVLTAVGLGAVVAGVTGCSGRTGGKFMRTGGDVIPLRDQPNPPVGKAP